MPFPQVLSPNAIFLHKNGNVFCSIQTYLQKYCSSNHWDESKNFSITEVSFYESRCFGGSLRNYDSIGFVPRPWWFLVITALRTFWPDAASRLCSTVFDEHIFSGYIQSLFFLINLYFLTSPYPMMTSPIVWSLKCGKYFISVVSTPVTWEFHSVTPIFCVSHK